MERRKRKSTQRVQFLPDLQPHSPAMGYGLWAMGYGLWAMGQKTLKNGPLRSICNRPSATGDLQVGQPPRHFLVFRSNVRHFAGKRKGGKAGCEGGLDCCRQPCGSNPPQAVLACAAGNFGAIERGGRLNLPLFHLAPESPDKKVYSACQSSTGSYIFHSYANPWY